MTLTRVGFRWFPSGGDGCRYWVGNDHTASRGTLERLRCGSAPRGVQPPRRIPLGCRLQSGIPPSPTRAPPYREAVSWRYCPVSPAPRQYHQHTCACAGALGSSLCESFSRSRHTPAALPAPAAFAEKRSKTAKAPAPAPPSVADTVSRVTDLWSASPASSWPLPFHRTRGPCSRHHLW